MLIRVEHGKGVKARSPLPKAEDRVRTARAVDSAACAARRPVVPGRVRCICAPSCGPVRAAGRSSRRSAPLDADPGSSQAPQGRSPRRPSANRERSSAIGAPPDLPGRAPGGPASHLGKIQTALLGKITLALTACAAAGLAKRVTVHTLRHRLRNPPPGERRRHPHHPGAARPRQSVKHGALV
jgi:hypothetical protein